MQKIEKNNFAFIDFLHYNWTDGNVSNKTGKEQKEMVRIAVLEEENWTQLPWSILIIAIFVCQL